MAVRIDQLRDIVNLTRTTELKKGSWVSLASDLSDFPFYSSLVQRVVRRSSFEYGWTVTQDENPDDQAEYIQVGESLQTNVDPMARRLTVRLAKVLRAYAYAEDEEELQGTSEEELVNVVNARKAEKLDLKLLSFFEHELADDAGGTSAFTKQPIFGLKYWLPHKAAATDLELNGGGDPSGFAAGAAGLTVADAEFHAHAVCGFNEVADDDLFDKLTEFHTRVNYFVPEGVNALDARQASRCILCQVNVFVVWSRLQSVANDNPVRDLGQWRNAIFFNSIPVKWWPVISEPTSAQCPTDFGLLYDLDLNTFKLLIHSSFNFDMQMGTNVDEIDVVKIWRRGYTQLACVNRRKNLVAYTDSTHLISKVSA